MNPLVQSQLDRLADAVGKMAGLLESASTKIDAQVSEKERTTLEVMGKNRRIAILEENVTTLNEVLEENRRLREKQSQASQHAARLLAHVRELQGKFTP